MKLTKSKLKQIIKEELEEVAGVGLSDREADPDFSNSPEQLKRKVHRLETSLSYCEMYSKTLRNDLRDIMERYGADVAADIEAALNRD